MTQDRGRILVVDDEPDFAEMVGELLAQEGYEVLTAGSAGAALERAKGADIAAAFVDLGLPDMGGIELAGQLRAADPDTQVVILTGQGDLETAIEGIHRGIFDYLQKAQVKAQRLLRVAGEATEKSRLARENRRLVGHLRESNRVLHALLEVSGMLAAEPHLDRILLKLVAAAKDLVGAAAGRALLLSRTSSEGYVVDVAVGDGTETMRGTRLHQREGIALLAIEQDEALAVENPGDQQRFSPRCDAMPTEKPGLLCAPLRHRSVCGVLMVAGRPLTPFGPADCEAFASLARQAAVAIENAGAHDRSVNYFIHTSDILVSCLEAVDLRHPGHSRRTARLADMISRRLGLPEQERRSVHFGALLHDIGKLRLDASVLGRDGPVTADERRAIEHHPALGLEILRPITIWEEILPIIHLHHERWDGNGYPRGLAGEEIPLGARIVAVAESFDAMTRPRGPHPAPESALAEIEARAGSQFDPKIVRLFIAEYRQHGDPQD